MRVTRLVDEAPGTSSEGLLERIGNTPLVAIRKIVPSGRVQVFAKLEGFNPSGSVKIRPAYSMIRDGEMTGKLTSGRIILDATSGNTGIAYALIGAVKGYRVLLAMPANAGQERRKVLCSYGARIILTDPLEGPDGAVRVVRELYERDPGKYFYPDQYSNDANWRAHYETTAQEIYRQMNGEITHFVAGLGTTGTFTGTTRRLRELEPGLRAVCFVPDSPFHGIEGLKHLPTSMVPSIFDPTLPWQQLEISTEEAQAMTRRLAREEGLFVGVSSGAAMAAAARLVANLDRGRIAVVFPDHGDRYLSEGFWLEGGGDD
jgi:S-sulfo-L-cysteine synthase (O-acetyl-L-serine-dependent)